MTVEQAKQLLEKIKNGSASQQEKLNAQKAINVVVNNLFNVPN